MPDTGWKYPTNSRDTPPGDFIWNAGHWLVRVCDTIAPNVYFTLKNTKSERLEGYDFNMNVPAGATINGIQVGYTSRADPGRDSPYGGNISCGECYLMKNLVRVGSNQANPYNWASSWGGPVSGGAANLWGTTWTAAEINSNQFGVSFVVNQGFNGNSTYAWVDCFWIKVYYTLGGFINIEKIYGIPISSIAKINGIPIEDIEKINGIT